MMRVMLMRSDCARQRHTSRVSQQAPNVTPVAGQKPIRSARGVRSADPPRTTPKHDDDGQSVLQGFARFGVVR